MKHDDDDSLIPWTEDLPPRVPPDEYDAVVLSAKRVTRFGLLWAEFRFRLVTQGEFFDTVLSGYCNLGPEKHPRIRSRSKIASWQRAIAAFTGGSPSKVTLKSFQHFWLRVRVETVTHNHRKRVLHDRDKYSSVTDIIAVVGKLSELPEKPPSSERTG